MAIIKYRDPTTAEYYTIQCVQGEQGPAGKQGAAGVGIEDILWTASEDHIQPNELTIKLDNGNSYGPFKIYNGQNGEDGKKGQDGGISEMSFSSTNSALTYKNKDGETKTLHIYPDTITAINQMDKDKDYPMVAIDNDKKLYYNNNVRIKNNIMYGAGWNDYAEHRKTINNIKSGMVVYEVGDDTVDIAYERLMPACSIASDTYGFIIGEHEEQGVALAIAGRVLAYPYEDRNSYKPGDAVCSAPNGTVSKMTREEIINYPDRIIGYVSCVPEYSHWGSNNIEVNNRIWIKVI